jgi:hypothetical protein
LSDIQQQCERKDYRKYNPIHGFGIYIGGMKTEFWSGISTKKQTKNLMDPDDVSDIIVENLHPRKK